MQQVQDNPPAKLAHAAEAPIVIPGRLALTAIQTFFLGGIFFFCLLSAFYFAAPILLPIFAALLLKFVLHPIVRRAQDRHIPSAISSILIIAALVFTLFFLASAVSDPLSRWTIKLQEALPRLQEEAQQFKSRFVGMEKALSNAEHIMPGLATKTLVVAVKGTTLMDRLMAGTSHVASSLFQTIVVLLFLLLSGDTFLRRLVEILPRFQDKKSAVAISQQIEGDFSAYLLTISLANVGVGVATGLSMWACDLADPVMWGILAFALNYIPFIGPLVMTGLIVIAGFLTWPGTIALIPAGIYFGLHILEGQLITPFLLARRFTLNPVMIIISLIFWFWLWGIVGAILSTPLLAVTKIICDHIGALRPLGHLITGGAAKPAAAA